MTGFSPSVMDVLRQVAPVIGGAIGSAIPVIGPGIGTVAGSTLAKAAVEALGKSLGVPPIPAVINDRIEADLRVIKANGSDALLRQADLNLKLKQAQDVELAPIAADLELGRQKLANEDTANARATFSEHKDYTQKSIGFLVVVGFLVAIAYAMKFGLPEGNRDLLLILAGTLTAAFLAVIQYYFGSSQGSKRSADTLRNIAENK